MKSMMVPLLLLLATSGCMVYQEARVGPLGYSVNQTHYQQIADKSAASAPGTEVSSTGTDGPLAEKTMDAYRGVTGKAAEVAQPIQINIGK